MWLLAASPSGTLTCWPSKKTGNLFWAPARDKRMPSPSQHGAPGKFVDQVIELVIVQGAIASRTCGFRTIRKQADGTGTFPAHGLQQGKVILL